MPLVTLTEADAPAGPQAPPPADSGLVDGVCSHADTAEVERVLSELCSAAEERAALEGDVGVKWQAHPTLSASVLARAQACGFSPATAQLVSPTHIPCRPASDTPADPQASGAARLGQLQAVVATVLPSSVPGEQGCIQALRRLLNIDPPLVVAWELCGTAVHSSQANLPPTGAHPRRRRPRRGG